MGDNAQYNVYDDVESNQRTKGIKESMILDPVSTTSSSNSHNTEL